MPNITTDDSIAEFARLWGPFGGGSAEDIFVTFGLSPAEYFRRLRELVRSKPDLFGNFAPALDELCARKLSDRTPPRATLM
ncbi:hypothetical protein [Rhodococcoides fascians]|uniref:hypothetical protein n=1 Tax=Rhodococcoides fascians TaxID=1828 RepID=UPI00050C0CC4|nr:hypothetical protein [Rhodococcus fascians]